MKEQRSQLQLQKQPQNPKDWSWSFWLAVPFYPYNRRRSHFTEVVKDTIWTIDQLHGILYTVVPIRMTIVKLEAGGLLVYAPVAPTIECVRMVNELVEKYGEVKYIILPTSSGLEHKVFVGPFARCFPQALVFVAPNQWSFPFNLPLTWLGFPRKRTQELPLDSKQAAFRDEFDYAILDIDLGKGSFAEVAFFHKRSHTLLVTDSILSVPENPPAILELEPYPLLFHARDNALDVIVDNEANRRKGWQRISLFAVYFSPSALKTIGLKQAFKDAWNAPNHSAKAYFGFFPFEWKPNWKQSFDAMRNNGHPFVAPILQTLILPQAPRQVLDWVDKVASWNFERIIACHFDSPIKANSYKFRQAFNFLRKKDELVEAGQNIVKEDSRFIRELEENLVKRGIATPARNS
jgi:hypothetical protein